MPFFVEVARRKSFTRAADALDIPIATLSRRIAAMEKDLGIHLLRRTTRSVDLTEEGERFYKSCEFIVAEAEQAREGLLRDQRIPAGRVRLSMPATAYFMYLEGALWPFAERYPQIDLHVQLSARWVDLNTEPFDLEIRVGPLPDSGLRVRKLATMHTGIYAAPKLLEKYPMPEKPRDLAAMPYIHLTSASGNALTLTNGDIKETIEFISPRFVINSPVVALEFILAAQAFGGLEVSVAEKYVKEGTLVHLLPEWHTRKLDISLVMSNASLPYRVRVFIDYLVQHYAEMAL